MSAQAKYFSELIHTRPVDLADVLAQTRAALRILQDCQVAGGLGVPRLLRIELADMEGQMRAHVEDLEAVVKEAQS